MSRLLAWLQHLVAGVFTREQTMTVDGASSSAGGRTSPLALTEEALISKCDYFTDVHLWPLNNEVSPANWLSNFEPSELPLALKLLDSFLYYSHQLVDELFISAFQQLSDTVAFPGAMPLTVQSAWKQFCADVIVTHVEGETPSTEPVNEYETPGGLGLLSSVV